MLGFEISPTISARAALIRPELLAQITESNATLVPASPLQVITAKGSTSRKVLIGGVIVAALGGLGYLLLVPPKKKTPAAAPTISGWFGRKRRR